MQMIRDVGDDDPFLEQKRGLEQKGALVVEQVLPLAGGDKFGQDDGYQLVAVLVAEPGYVP